MKRLEIYPIISTLPVGSISKPRFHAFASLQTIPSQHITPLSKSGHMPMLVNITMF